MLDTMAVRNPGCKFIAVSRDRAKALRRANLTKYLAAQWDCYPEVVAEEADLMKTDAVAELIAFHRPDIIFNATTPFPWWKLDLLPDKEKLLANKAGPGIWCALDCLLPLCLTKALESANSSAIFVNGCYPDLTNAFLANLPCAPKLGIGNISNLVPGLKLGFATELGIHPMEVTVRIIGHHFVSWNAPTGAGCPDAPYELEIIHPRGSLRFHGPDDTPFAVLRRNASRVRGVDGLGVTIGSSATLLDELVTGGNRLHHCPGANGLPGGYPIRISGNGTPALDLPDDLTESDAIAVNQMAQIHDGVRKVSPGSAEPTEMAREAHQFIVGMGLPTITVDNAIEISMECLRRLESKFSLGLAKS